MDSTSKPRRRAPWWRWLPIRPLAERHREHILAHLLALDGHDRYLRFGYPASDERIRVYVTSLDFSHDDLFGIFNRRLQLVAVVQLAYTELAGARQGLARMAEFAVSVDRRCRGRDYGDRLFAHALRHARNRGVDRLMIHALSENTAMLRIARKAGADVLRDGTEAEAWLKLPPDSFASRLEERLADQAAGLNYAVKLQARRLQYLWIVGRHLPHRLMRLAGAGR